MAEGGWIPAYAGMTGTVLEITMSKQTNKA